MASGCIDQHTRDPSESTLLHLLSNTLVLRQTVPYLTPSALLSVAATAKPFRHLLHNSPDAFRHLDLTRVKSTQFSIDPIDTGVQAWRDAQLDENLTEDDFYAGPLRGIFGKLKRNVILRDVQTLVLDGLSVTAELINDILTDPEFNVRILSIRETKNLNERRLMQSLKYACRKTRPDGSPQLKALYVFGKRDHAPAAASASSSHASSAASTPSLSHAEIMKWNHKSCDTLHKALSDTEDDWYQKRGRIISKPITDGWAETLLDCREAIRFDAVLCTGPRHPNSPAYGKHPVSATPGGSNGHAWNVATFALGGCASCGCAPEGFTVYGDSAAEELPLLSPLPLHSSNAKCAAAPSFASSAQAAAGKPRFVPRCYECIRERYCFACKQWWCEACYGVPAGGQEIASHAHHMGEPNDAQIPDGVDSPPRLQERKITRSCWECENNCMDCIAHTQRLCRACGGGYCIIHYDGSTMTLCDWCSRRGRRIHELY